MLDAGFAAKEAASRPDPSGIADSATERRSRWRGRDVRLTSGSWETVRRSIPEFGLESFAAISGGAPNPYLRAVVRRPMSASEKPVPIATVSPSYALLGHRDVGELCRGALAALGLDPSDLRFELGLSELGEWMKLSVLFPSAFGFVDRLGHRVTLRFECFNSVDGSSRLAIAFGWYRQICSNGLIVATSKVEIKERHRSGLDLLSVLDRIGPAFDSVLASRSGMENLQYKTVQIENIRDWVNGTVAPAWGKLAAARVFHICRNGRDSELADPFAPGDATDKPVRLLSHVPGSPEEAATLYDVLQALTYVASRRNSEEERVTWQAEAFALLLAFTVPGPARPKFHEI